MQKMPYSYTYYIDRTVSNAPPPAAVYYIIIVTREFHVCVYRSEIILNDSRDVCKFS